MALTLQSAPSCVSLIVSPLISVPLVTTSLYLFFCPISSLQLSPHAPDTLNRSFPFLASPHLTSPRAPAMTVSPLFSSLFRQQSYCNSFILLLFQDKYFNRLPERLFCGWLLHLRFYCASLAKRADRCSRGSRLVGRPSRTNQANELPRSCSWMAGGYHRWSEYKLSSSIGFVDCHV